MKKIIMYVFVALFCAGAIAFATSAAIDTFSSHIVGLNDPAYHAFAITASDSSDLTYVTRAMYIGSGGNINMKMAGGETVVLNNVPTGVSLNVRIARVLASATTATGLVGMY